MLLPTWCPGESMSRRNYIIGAVAALVVIFALVYFYGGSQTPATQPQLVRLTPENVAQVEAEFNAAREDVRLLVMLSPT
jgi:hypothetical protein